MELTRLIMHDCARKKKEVKKKFLTIREFFSTSSATCKSPKNAETLSGSQRQHRFIIVIVKCEAILSENGFAKDSLDLQ